MHIEKARLYIILVCYLIFIFSDLVIRVKLGTAMGNLKMEVNKDINGFGNELISASLFHLSTWLLTWLFFLLDLIILPSFFLNFIIFTIFFSSLWKSSSKLSSESMLKVENSWIRTKENKPWINNQDWINV